MQNTIDSASYFTYHIQATHGKKLQLHGIPFEEFLMTSYYFLLTLRRGRVFFDCASYSRTFDKPLR
jgi:hypothetical protein